MKESFNELVREVLYLHDLPLSFGTLSYLSFSVRPPSRSPYDINCGYTVSQLLLAFEIKSPVNLFIHYRFYTFTNSSLFPLY